MPQPHSILMLKQNCAQLRRPPAMLLADTAIFYLLLGATVAVAVYLRGRSGEGLLKPG